MTRGTAAACLALALGSAHSGVGEYAHAAAESQLYRVLDLVATGRLKEAIVEVDSLVAKHPNFRLAHLVRGDLLLAHAQPLQGPGAGARLSERLSELRSELQARARDLKEPPPAGHLPRYLLQLEPAQRHAIVIDARLSRVYVYENAEGTPRLVRDYYSTIGRNGALKEREGDRKTPIGAYHITSHITGRKLPDLYGWGAFPLNYPNEWDRRLGRTGYGIWIHGVPSDTYARSPLASDGCVVLANPEMEELAQYVRPGTTPVVIADGVEWAPAEVWRSEALTFKAQLEQWRRDWESRDLSAYLSHYSKSFRADGMDYAAWADHKKRATGSKKWIKVDLSSVGILRNPGPHAVMVVTFEQHYRSDRLSQRSRKRQYWILEDGRWKIGYESQLKQPALVLPESYPNAPKRHGSRTRG